MPEPKRHYLGLCAIAKDETRFLHEWVAYHRLIGFEHIFIYDNESAEPVSDSLADLHAEGFVDIFEIQGKAMQLVAYNHCLKHFGEQYEWMAFFDLDEFLLLKEETDARAFLSAYEETAGLCLTMCNFGSSGHLSRPQGLVLENYRECTDCHISVKCIVRPRFVKMPLSPHHFIYTQGRQAINPDKIPAFGGYAPRSTDKAQINHYSFRSQQDYEEKIGRGDAIYLDQNPRSMEKFYAHTRLKNEIREDILRHVPRLKSLMQGGQGPYYACDFSQVGSEDFPLALRRLAGALEKDPGEAYLLFSLCRRRFADKASYLTLGIQACLAAHKYRAAEEAALRLIAAAPLLGSYRQLLSVYLAADKKAEADAMEDFLQTCARYENMNG